MEGYYANSYLSSSLYTVVQLATMDFQILSSARLDRFFIHSSYETGFGELLPANCYANIAARYTRALAPNTALLSRESSCTADRRASCINVVRSSGRHLFDLAEENNGNEKDQDGPVELPQGLNPFEVPDASPLQTAASVLLTGAIAVLLYRSVKRRAKRATKMKFRSSGVESVSVREEAKSEALKALEKLKVAQEVKAQGSPSPVQALVGAVIAGVIAFVLYNFTISVESALDKQTLSTSYSVRQITITVRTIINGICYLATFVFALNSVGLTLYSGQLAIKSWIDIFKGESDSKPMETESKIDVEVKDDNQ